MFCLDVQGFQGPNNKFIVKELAVQLVENGDLACLHYNPPYEWDELPQKYKKTNRWLTHNYHGIPWETGNFPYDNLQDDIRLLTEQAEIIFVNGLQKQRWLESYTDKLIINLNDFGSSKAKDIIVPRCWVHKGYSVIDNYTCALENCLKLKEWYRTYFSSTLDPSINSHECIQDMWMKQPDSLHFMTTFLVKFAWQHIDDLWDGLSEQLKKMSEIQDCKRCYLHYPTSTNGEDIIDGPPPMIKNCSVCNKYI